MCTPSTVEMYRVVNIDDPDTYPGTFGENVDSIHVVNSQTDLEAHENVTSSERDTNKK